MAGPGTRTDLKIYEPQFQSGMWEGLTQVTDAFNGASRNALRLIPNEQRGTLVKEAFFRRTSGLITRRDHTSVAAADSAKLVQDEMVKIKLDRKVIVDTTVDSFRKAFGSSPDMGEFSLQLGRQFAAEKALEMLNTSITAVRAVIAKGTTTTTFTAPTNVGIKHSHLGKGLRLVGDQASGIVAWIMQGGIYADLMVGALDSATAAFDALNGVIVNSGSTPTLGRPSIVTDAPALATEGESEADPDTFDTLGLFAGAVSIEESEREIVVSEMVTGLEQLIFRTQMEYSYTIGVRGFKWAGDGDDAVNPANSALADTTHWTAVVSDPVKQGPGVMIVNVAAP